MYLKYKEHFILNGFEGIDIDMFKLFLLLYADDIVIMSETEKGSTHGLFLLEHYCDRWKLTVNHISLLSYLETMYYSFVTVYVVPCRVC